ncbi:TonB-dependent receptor [uncultured Paludibaculum sp.]|uniref:TonB-dependent receptor n=1 Tax=uncultured Paludibaculum sp. TaxID=1765020 RepID=UPI002AABA3CD|nr:TonB-dependent receptor [uncultured Paludibaculum sp.]
MHQRYTCLWICCFLASSHLFAQSTAALAGRVTDPSGAPVAAARVVVRNALTNFERQAESDADGAFQITNIPARNYEVNVSAPGFRAHESTISLSARLTLEFDVRLDLAANETKVSVSASDRALLVNAEETGTRAQLSEADIGRMALQVGNRGLEAVVVSFPGFAQNANGAIHPRGAHNQLSFIIDGMPITDQLTGAFANSVDPNIVQNVELFTGNIPAEFGNKVSAVVNVTSKTGLGTGRLLGGSIAMSGAGFDTASQVAQVAGEKGRLGFTASLNTMKSNRYLDQVALDNLHNGGNSQRAFSRLDYQAGAHDVLRVNLLAGRSSFELANLRSQQARGMDARQELRDFSAALGWVHTFNANTLWSSNSSYRTTVAQLQPSAGDFPVTAAQARHLSTVTLLNQLGFVRGRHNIRFGADVQHFPVSENFSFGITDPSFNDPQSPTYLANLLAFDLSRGGSLFQFSRRASGSLYSSYLQDEINLGRWHISAGLRFDNYRFLVHGSQFQPRLGLSYSVKGTGTVLRASYNRLYQTPPNENLLISNSDESSVLVAPDIRATVGNAVVKIRPERQNLYEVGLQQPLGRRLSLNASFYHKDAQDQQDNNSFFNTPIIFPMQLKSIRVNSVEGRMVVTPVKGFSGSLSVTHARAISTPPFTGGLYIGNGDVALLNSGPFVIDHDQVLSLQTIVNYTAPKGFYATCSMRYDSGLVTAAVDPAVVRNDPDYADLLPLVNLTSNPPRTRPRAIADVVLGYQHVRGERRQWEASLQISNVTNKYALYNFQSAFVGTRLVQPRTAGVRLTWFF